MERKRIQFGRVYTSTEAMVKAAVGFGFRHCGGRGFVCKYCKDRSSARKFILDKIQVYACNKCGARW